MTDPDLESTLTAVHGGVEAIEAGARRASPRAATPCHGWSVHQLVRHVETVAGCHVIWTGAAIGGRIAALRTDADLHAYNELMLDRLPELSMDEHVARFGELARDHVRLARVSWSTAAVRTPTGEVLTVGQHVALTAVEWHVHAWDLARARDATHRPDAVALDVLTTAWDDTLSDVTGVARSAGPDAWDSLLTATGRTP